MKHAALPFLFCSLFVCSTYSQDAVEDLAVVTEERLAPTVVERGPHHRVWETTTLVTDAEGLVVTNVGSYVELGTGLHYWDDRS
jgi:hypothetical protein